MSSEYAWVIEHGASEVSRPRYWGGIHGWTFDHSWAIRFAREQDARWQAGMMDDGFPENFRICEHGWLNPSTKTIRSVAPKEPSK